MTRQTAASAARQSVERMDSPESRKVGASLATPAMECKTPWAAVRFVTLGASSHLEAPLERVQVRADLLRRAPPRQRGVQRPDAVALELDLERHAGGAAAGLREGHRLARPQRARQRAEAPARAGLVVRVLRADLAGGDAGDAPQLQDAGPDARSAGGLEDRALHPCLPLGATQRVGRVAEGVLGRAVDDDRGGG